MKIIIYLRRFTLTLAIVGLAYTTQAQQSVPEKYANTITAQDLFKHVNVLASDSLEGRNTGEKGQKMAADYIKSQFMTDNLQGPVKEGEGNGYYQTFTLEKSGFGEVYLKINGERKTHLKGNAFIGSADMEEEATTDAIFVGRGDSLNYVGLDVKDKAVIIYVPDRNDRKKKLEVAKAQGASKFFVISATTGEEFSKFVEDYHHYFTDKRVGFPREAQEENIYFLMSPAVIADAMKKPWKDIMGMMDKKGKGKKNPLASVKPLTLAYKVKMEREDVTTENVLGYIEGKSKKDELLVITAHYDHIGKTDTEVYNGANDDASGTAAVMEIAQAFAKAKADGNGPERSILCLTVTGEEKGLLGSLYYTDNPVFPLENTVVNLNIDMIGRIDKEHEENQDYVYVIGSGNLSKELKAVSETANRTYTKLDLDYRFDGDDPNRYYYRSDHYNFAKNNIPIIFYFNGIHDDYHRVTDTIEKLAFDKMENITKLVFYTAWEVANRNEKIKVDLKAGAE